MHCNDAPGAVARLDDMGIAPFLIASSVILSCAQRLMRRICPACKEPAVYPEKIFKDLGIDVGYFEGVQLYKGRGCERCKGSGYAGRVAILEVLPISHEIHRMIVQRSSAQEIGKVAVEEGMKTLRVAGLDKVREGISTLEQVLVCTSAH
jgi:type IV pilus assembly protein PilB